MTYRYAAGTSVATNRSRDEVERLLDRVGADSIATMRDSAAAAVAFRLNGRNYVLKVPFPADDEISMRGRRRSRVEIREEAIRERWRGLLLLVKAKVVAIQTGISTPEREFLAHAMLPTGQTLSEHLEEHPEELTTTGRLMLPGGD